MGYVCFFIGGSASGGEKLSQTEQQIKEGEERARNNVIITYASVSTPPGRLLLIRRDANYCAVRFTSFHWEPNQATRWRAGDFSHYAEYDWYYQGDGSGDFTRPGIQSGHRQLSRKPAIGLFHPFVWGRGDPFVRCGPFVLIWYYPTHVGFHMTNKKEDGVENELAPTKWEEISEVNVHDARLSWYRFDAKRKEVDVPMNRLW